MRDEPPDLAPIPIETLTRREREVLALLVEDLSNREIAQVLTIEPDSVKWYTKQIYAKLGVHDRRQAVSKALALGLVAVKSQAAGRSSGNLPAEVTTFVGRQPDVERVRSLLNAPTGRLVTLTGGGGVGKTRLALKVAEEIAARGDAEVWLVELGAVGDPALVVETVNTVFGLPIEKDQTPLGILQNHLRSKKLLLVLDTCEHLVAGCASLATSLLKTCPHLKILATSREALGVPGEAPYEVAPLPVPEPGAQPDGLAACEAVALFVQRSRSALPGFELTPASAPAVARICRRLDGIPLAIELAAARVKVLSVEQIATRLEASFDLLSGGSRTALPRHQTMRASIDWSYHLLSEAERRLLERLSVFSGGWTLEAAEQVCADPALPAAEIFDLLTQLIYKSLVRVSHSPGSEVTYGLLDMVQKFAAEALHQTGQATALRRRHGAWYTRFAETASQNLNSAGRLAWQKKIEAAYDNLRAALHWSLVEGAYPELGARLAAALSTPFWVRSEHRLEGLRWLNLALNPTASQDGWIRGRVLHSLAFLDVTASPLTRLAWLENAQELLNSAGPEAAVDAIAALSQQGQIEAFDLGNLHQGLALLNESEARLRQLGEEGRAVLAVTLVRKSSVLAFLNNSSGALDCIQESSRLCQDMGDPWKSSALCLLGDRALQQGQPALALAHYEEALAAARAWQDQHQLASCIKKIGDVERARRNYAAAFRLYGETLAHYMRTGWLTWPRSFAWLLESLALNEAAWGAQGGPQAASHDCRAACILGIEQALLESVAMPVLVEQRSEYDQALVGLQERLGAVAFHMARAEGRAMSVKETVELVLKFWETA